MHDVALEIGLAINQSTYDTRYVDFAVAIGADKVVVADGPFIRANCTRPDTVVAGMLLPLNEWQECAAGG